MTAPPTAEQSGWARVGVVAGGFWAVTEWLTLIPRDSVAVDRDLPATVIAAAAGLWGVMFSVLARGDARRVRWPWLPMLLIALGMLLHPARCLWCCSDADVPWALRAAWQVSALCGALAVWCSWSLRPRLLR